MPVKNSNFFSRDLSWIEFNKRVLGEALRADRPLLERLKFIAITSSNFDEFFMVRVASIKRQVQGGDYVTCPSGMKPSVQLQKVRRAVKDVLAQQYDCLLGTILPELAKEGIVYVPREKLDLQHQEFLRDRFAREIFPVLTPVRFDPENLTGVFGNQRLHVAFLLEKEAGTPLGGGEEAETGPSVAIVQIPSSLNRIVYLPETQKNLGFTFLEAVIILFARDLFPGYRILEHMAFRITRDADFGVDESRDDDFMEAMEQVVSGRDLSNVVRMNVSCTSKRLCEVLRSSLGLEEDEIFEIRDPLDPTVFFEIAGLKGFDHLREQAWRPVEHRAFLEEDSIFAAIKKGDIVVHQPYESFGPVVRLVETAAEDPAVLAIKMTLYRTSGDSPIVQALEKAARNGKHVTVLVELKARFDEARNISWAERLNQAGATVIQGAARLKVHAKALLVVRKEPDGIARYVHLSTGNYNDRTARMYTDISFFTCRNDFCYEAGLFFNSITGYSVIPILKTLVMAPVNLRSRILQLIDREIQKSSAETPGCIVAKLNALADAEVINALYIASQAGVKIRLLVRGICMLVPGIPGKSENIQVHSVLDRFLEHARILYFRNGGQEEYYASSADWMPRNLDRRVELMFPIPARDDQLLLREILDTQWSDTTNSWELGSDGTYRRKDNHEADGEIRSQKLLYMAAVMRNQDKNLSDKREFQVRKMQ